MPGGTKPQPTYGHVTYGDKDIGRDYINLAEMVCSTLCHHTQTIPITTLLFSIVLLLGAALITGCQSTTPLSSPTALPAKILPSSPPLPPTTFPSTLILEMTFDIKPPPTETVTPSPTPTPILGRVEQVTSGHYFSWNRYIHPKYGFAFSFPPDWKIIVENAHFVGLASRTIPGFVLHIRFNFSFMKRRSQSHVLRSARVRCWIRAILTF